MIGLEDGACRVCGCTDSAACPGGCWWVEEDLCSACEGVARGEPSWPVRLTLAGILAGGGIVLALALVGVANAVRYLSGLLQP